MATADLLASELKGLRKGRGATLTKLKSCPNLLATLQVKSPAEAVAALKTALSDLKDSPEAQALVAALALDGSATTLTDRRATFAATIDRSVDTVEAYENRAIEELVELIFTPEEVADTSIDTHPDLTSLDSNLTLAQNALRSMKIYADVLAVNADNRVDKAKEVPNRYEEGLLDTLLHDLLDELEGMRFGRNVEKAVKSTMHMVVDFLGVAVPVMIRETYAYGQIDAERRVGDEILNLRNFILSLDDEPFEV